MRGERKKRMRQKHKVLCRWCGTSFYSKHTKPFCSTECELSFKKFQGVKETLDLQKEIQEVSKQPQEEDPLIKRQYNGEPLKRRLREENLSKEDLAELLDVDVEDVNKWLLGEKKPPNYIQNQIESLFEINCLPEKKGDRTSQPKAGAEKGKTITYYRRICRTCGRFFMTDSAKAEYCSPACFDNARNPQYQNETKTVNNDWNKEYRKCKYCGTQFIPEDPNQKYCGLHCSDLSRKKQEELIRKEEIEKQAQLKADIILKRYQLNNTNKITKRCPVCGKDFEATSKKKIYCCEKCRTKANNLKRKSGDGDLQRKGSLDSMGNCRFRGENKCESGAKSVYCRRVNGFVNEEKCNTNCTFFEEELTDHARIELLEKKVQQLEEKLK